MAVRHKRLRLDAGHFTRNSDAGEGTLLKGRRADGSHRFGEGCCLTAHAQRVGGRFNDGIATVTRVEIGVACCDGDAGQPRTAHEGITLC